MTPEGKVQALILQWATVQPGIMLRRDRTAEAGRGRRKIAASDLGLPDLCGWVEVDGLAIYCGVEVKAPGAKPQRHEDAQREWGELITRAGGLHVRASCLNDVMAAVMEFRARKGTTFGL